MALPNKIDGLDECTQLPAAVRHWGEAGVESERLASGELAHVYQR